LILYFLDRKYETIHGEVETRTVHLLGITQICRLMRIPRVNSLTKSSTAIQNWWGKQDVAQAMLITFMFNLIVVSHWIACFWSFIAFIQVRSFGSPLGQEANWISNWYETSYVEGGIEPIGWQNDIDRYALSLFWSIQSLTSIGYGNIVPVTRLEYYFANLLMLGSGIFWAFVIGNIVSIYNHMHSVRNQYKQSLDEANAMVDCFSPPSVGGPNDNADIGVGDPKVIATRIRRFVTLKYDEKMVSHPTSENSSSLNQVFPTLDGLSLELRRLSSLHLMRKYIEMVPYLSHKYLTPEEQSELAFKCIFLEFSRGESFFKHPQYGRGIMILRRGVCMNVGSNALFGSNMYSRDEPVSINDILVEDSFLGKDLPHYQFVSYSQVVFIPQSVIYEVLNGKKKPWNDCARWKYLHTCLLKWSKENNAIK